MIQGDRKEGKGGYREIEKQTDREIKRDMGEAERQRDRGRLGATGRYRGR